MSDIRELLQREVRSIHPDPEGLREALRRGKRRSTRRRIGTAILALIVGFSGTAIAMRVFSAGSARPASVGTPNYRMSVRLMNPGEDVPDRAVRGPDFVWVHTHVRWDSPSYPGVRRCTWEVLDARGEVISRRSDLYMAPETSRGETDLVLKMLNVTGEPAGARARCAKQRLDAPRITRVQPWSSSGSHAQNLREMRRRVKDWEERFGVEGMAREELEGNLWALWQAFVRPSDRHGRSPSMVRQELGSRISALCLRLPPDHPFRGGEFCQ